MSELIHHIHLGSLLYDYLFFHLYITLPPPPTPNHKFNKPKISMNAGVGQEFRFWTIPGKN